MASVTLPSRVVRRLKHDLAVAELESDVRRVLHGGTRTQGAGKKVGFASFGAGEWHLAWELVLARALEIRDARPIFLMCDLPDLPICAERLFNSSAQDRCGGCIATKRDLLDAAGAEWQGMSAFVKPTTVDRARRIARDLAPNEIESFAENGVPIGRWLHVGASSFLRADARGDSAAQVATRRRLLATAIVGLNAIEEWLDRAAPDVVMVQGGAQVLSRIARERARARGIPVISRELGKGGWDRQIFALNHDAMAPDLDAAWATASAQPLTAAEDATVGALTATLTADTYGPIASDGTRSFDPITIDPGTRTAVAFTNVTWDLATADRDVAFTGVYDWLRETIDALSPYPDVRLIVRAHPAEASVVTQERILEQIAAAFPSHPGLICIPPEHPVTASELFRDASLVLAYNSTAGLEASMHGRPVVVSGAPHFRGRGFTIDIDRREQYRELLTRWAGGEPQPVASAAGELARRYFHLFFARYHVSMGWTTSPLDPPYRLRLTSVDELMPGRNAAVDLVCDGILNGRQILWPAGAGA